MRPPVIFLPEHRRGHGVGHFSRVVSLAAEIGVRAFIYLPTHLDPERREALRAIAAARNVEDRLLDSLPGEGTGRRRFFVVDRREVTGEELERLRRTGFVVALDAGGSGRQYCDYLVDVLPRVDDAPANVRDLRLLDLPAPGPSSKTGAAVAEPSTSGVSARGASAPSPGRVLVTFGGDDPRGITARVVAAILSTGRYTGADIDVLLPQLSPKAAEAAAVEGRGIAPGGDVHFISGPVDLRETIAGYETVVTSFGLTAFEAAWAGAEVLLVNASRYHEQLARRTGFRSVAVGRPPLRRLSRLLVRRMRTGGGADRVGEKLVGAESISLATLISSLDLPHVHDCPACAAREGRVLARFEHRTYVRCADCGMIYLRSFEAPRDYTEDYFFEEYRRQYGKTYLEDARQIRRMGQRRLEDVARAASHSDAPRLIDIGCAYGPFLSAAAGRGYEAVGVDVSGAAVSYVVSELGLPAFRMTIEELAASEERPRALERGGAGVVTMWYVIEHLPDLAGALAAVSDLLEPGGVFAFSTPSSKGISARRNLRDFLRRSPPDHFTVWSPRTARRVLSRCGFEVTRVRITGHHPERFPGASDLRAGGARRRVLLAVSRALGLGDTFEVYAVKRTGNDE